MTTKFDFGDGDFTLTGFFPGVNKLAPDAEGWTHIRMARSQSKRMTFHTQETFEGVEFQSARTYGEDGRLESVQLTRLDLVRG